MGGWLTLQLQELRMMFSSVQDLKIVWHCFLPRKAIAEGITWKSFWCVLAQLRTGFLGITENPRPKLIAYTSPLHGSNTQLKCRILQAEAIIENALYINYIWNCPHFCPQQYILAYFIAILKGKRRKEQRRLKPSAHAYFYKCATLCFFKQLDILHIKIKEKRLSFELSNKMKH